MLQLLLTIGTVSAAYEENCTGVTTPSIFNQSSYVSTFVLRANNKDQGL